MNNDSHEHDIITFLEEQEEAQSRQDDDSNPDDDEGGSDSDNDDSGSVEIIGTSNSQNGASYLSGTTSTGSVVVSIYYRISFLLAILALVTVLPSYSSSSSDYHSGRSHDGASSSHPSNTNTATTLFTKVWNKWMSSGEDYNPSFVSKLSPVSSSSTKKGVNTKKDTETLTTSYFVLWSDLLFGGSNKEELDSSSSNHGQCREKESKKEAAMGDNKDDPFSLLQWFLGFDSLFYYNPHKSMAAFERLSGTTSSTSSSTSSRHSISSSSPTEKRSSSPTTTTTLEPKRQEETTTLFENCPFVEYRTLKRSTGNQTSSSLVLLPLFLDTNTNQSSHLTLWNTKLCPPPTVSTTSNNQYSSMSHDNRFVWSTIMEDIYASTPRLVAVTNIWPCLLLLLYFFVSYYFIGRYHHSDHHEQAVLSRRQQRRQGQRFPPSTNTTTGSLRGATAVVANEHVKCTSMYALRCGLGYVLFRLSLNVAVLKPLHTLDFLILTVWYSWICLLRSLAIMTFKNLDRVITKLVLQGGGGRGQPQHQQPQQQEDHGLYHSSSNNNNINIRMMMKTLQSHVQRAEPLCVGILSLLVVLLLSTMGTSISCIYMFKHCSGGWRMVALLVLDSIGVVVDVMKHLVTYLQGIILEQVYRDRLCDLETQLMNQSSYCVPVSIEKESSSSSSLVQENTTKTMKDIEHEIEDVEFMHHWLTTWSQFVTKGFELMSLVITVVHYMNLWHLHGLQFGLIDSILFFHLHWTLSTIRSKISDCQRMTHLKNQIQCSFDNATEEDLTIANHEGDVCCICLGNLYYTKTTNIKRLRGCKHLYHSHCLEKVVARVRSSESVKCPLCRNPMMGEKKPKTPSSNTASQQQQPTNNDGANTPPLNSSTVVEPDNVNGRRGNSNVDGEREELTNNNNMAGNNDNNNDDMMIHEDNVSILRFSTDRFVPSWLSLPSFSFEVVRRQAAAPQVPPVVPRPATEDRRGTNNNNNNHQLQPQEQTNNNDTVNAIRESTTSTPRGGGGGGGLLSMIFGGNASSSLSRGAQQQQTEEEMELALEQLMEMFPQYDRDDLLNELRRRGGSIEHVAERIILGQL